MSVTKRIDGNYTIEPIAVQPSADKMTVLYSEVVFASAAVFFDSDNFTIAGDLTVNGTANFIDRSDVIISDTIITLNAGEIAVGVGAPYYSGIEIDRGSLPDAKLVWRENLSTPEYPWFIINDGTGDDRVIVSSSLNNLDDDYGMPLWRVVDDSYPKLGGDLDVNGRHLVSSDGINITLHNTGNTGDIVLSASTTGNIVMNSPVVISGGTPSAAAAAGDIQIYSDLDTGGGTQIHFQNDTYTGELVSKTKAIVFSLVF